MPFTFAHPAAVLPLRKLTPRYLSFIGLAVGSVVPDLGYYLHNYKWSLVGHTFLGSISFGIPAGLTILACIFLFLKPITLFLPFRHRQVLVSIYPPGSVFSLTNLLVLAVSLVLGSWTHVVWDGFTHANGWCVRNIAALTPTLFSVGGYKILVWHILQHASSILGLFVLARVYINLVRAQDFVSDRSKAVFDQAELVPPWAKVFFWSFNVGISLFYALWPNLPILGKGLSIPHIDEFSFNTIVGFVCFIVPLLASSSVLGLLVIKLLGRKPTQVGSESLVADLSPSVAQANDVVRSA